MSGWAQRGRKQVGNASLPTSTAEDTHPRKEKPEASKEAATAWALLTAWFWCFSRDMAIVALPRLVVTLLHYSQPILISTTIAYVSPRVSSVGHDLAFSLNGYQIIVATVVIYVGRAVSRCILPLFGSYQPNPNSFLPASTNKELTALSSKHAAG